MKLLQTPTHLRSQLQAAQIHATTKACNRERKPMHTTVQEFVRTLTDSALNVNRFEQPVCGHEQNRFVETVEYAHNIRLKEILKKGALTVIRTVVHLTNSCGYTNSRASNPPFLKLL